MIRFRFAGSHFYVKKRFYSLKTSTDSAKTPKSFQHTVFLPKTSFPKYLKKDKLTERDKKIQEDARFLDFYSWQRENLRGKEFVLHDGPPYANGKPHMGHAINKILKDIILRSQVIQGNRVHYVPGWDCHGLPIEMKALMDVKETLTPKEIRLKARDVAESMSQVQMKAFKQWGVIGDWDMQCYYTFNPDYVANELQIFWKLFERGIIYYDLKPVYWSPSSQTALAEAELSYVDNHKSHAVTVRFKIIQNTFPEPLYLLVWTTTPWTLPMNKAVYCSSKFKYSVVKISSLPGLYVLASDLIETYQKSLKTEITETSVITCEDLMKLKYQHPWFKDQFLNIFESPDVQLSGTGFLHSVPAHGHEDYIMGLKNNLKVDYVVDDKGCYTSDIGTDLAGLNILDEGSKAVVERLSSEIILKEIYQHKYPYDWRTNKPVIIRASKQWFIDCEPLKRKAVEALKNVNVPVDYFLSMIKDRPYWCLSRQRKWGVPIPAFFHRTSGRPLVSKNLINHLSSLILSRGTDVWWTEDLETLFPKKLREEHFVKIEDIVKGEDIMDIWFDSGISWSYVLNGKKSELYLEGVDQYKGWFQSSLLTGVAVRNDSPFRRIKTHGFAVDKTGRKMSKSLGNVVDPETITEGQNPFGVDVLRWWVACHSHHTLVPVSDDLLKAASDDLLKIRSTFRFLLGSLNDASPENLTKVALTFLDRYSLNSCYDFYHSVVNSYNSYELQKVCARILYFVTNDVSSRYVTVIKDRLYCDEVNSTRRRACQYTLNGILETLCQVLAPIVPHLVEEVYSNHPVHDQTFFYKPKWTPPEDWRNESTSSIMALLDEIKKEVTREKTPLGSICQIHTNEGNFNLLKKLQKTEDSIDSELTEILQVAEVRLRIGEKKVEFFPTDSCYCLRCRRYTAPEVDKLCQRCETVVSNLVSPLL